MRSACFTRNAMSLNGSPPLRAQERPARLLYFTHSAGYRHDVLQASRDILKQLGATAGFEVTASEDGSGTRKECGAIPDSNRCCATPRYGRCDGHLEALRPLALMNGPGPRVEMNVD